MMTGDVDSFVQASVKSTIESSTVHITQVEYEYFLQLKESHTRPIASHTTTSGTVLS